MNVPFRPSHMMQPGGDDTNEAYMQRGPAVDDTDRSEKSVLMLDATWSWDTPSSGSRVLVKVANKCRVTSRPRVTAVRMKTEDQSGITRVSETKALGCGIFRQKSSSDSASVRSGKKAGSVIGEIKHKEMQYFRIDDSAAVGLYLTQMFLALQQQVNKKVAKAWIKAICPKKQAHFPYQQKKKKGAMSPDSVDEQEENTEPGKPPGWWPIDSCRHREPDHIRRMERVALLMHVLRLRATPEQLHEWNEIEGPVVPNNTHLIKGWTAFLEEQAPMALLDELTDEPGYKINRRPHLLREIFRVAQLEEDYHMGGCDGSVTFAFDPVAAKHEVAKAEKAEKRARELSDVSTPLSKRSKRSPQVVTRPVRAALSKRTAMKVTCDSISPIPDFPAFKNSQSPPESISKGPELIRHGSYSLASTPLTSSFGSVKPELEHFTDPYVVSVHNPFYVTEWDCVPAPRYTNVSAHSVTNVPEPRFDAVPNYYNWSSSQVDLGPNGHRLFDGRVDSAMPDCQVSGPAGGYVDHNNQSASVHHPHGGMHVGPNMHTPVGEVTEYNGTEPQFYQPHVPVRYPDHAPVPCFPPDALTGAMDRGFTGHGSGIGGGAWT